jgi:hypothetical protein
MDAFFCILFVLALAVSLRWACYSGDKIVKP